MSFFDDAEDEPQPSPRTPPRRPRTTSRPPRGRGSGGGRSSGGGQPNIQNRRLIAIGAVIVVVIILALLIRGCEANQTTNSLKTYSNDVSALISNSDLNGSRVFLTLSNDKGTTLSNNLDQQLKTARNQLTQAQNLSVPGQMSDAQQNLLAVMTQRQDGIHQMAANIASALSKSTSKDGVNELAIGTSLLYSSDVIYKNYVTRQIAKALNGDGITVCPPGTGATCANGSVAINTGQIVPSLSWLSPSYIAAKLGSPSSGVNGTQAGLHSDEVSTSGTSIDGTQLTYGSTTTITQSGAPKVTMTITNNGHWPEDPSCSVKISSSTATVANATSKQGPGTLEPGKSGTCTVAMPSKIPAGTYTLVARVDAVPKEVVNTNNTATYSVTFQ